MPPSPTLRHERALMRSTGATRLACVDEVGRGALCGPVSVGVVVIDATTKAAPRGVKDSKLLSPQRRGELCPLIERWAPAHAVGHASSAEIDAVGIIQALRTAALRAIAALSITPDLVLLDGNHDYLRAPVQDSLFALDSAPAFDIPVTTMVKGDMRCAGVAAASILAKTARDALMLELAAAYPEFGWAENKGYSAPEHLSALARFGPTPHHRLSWNLPTSRDEAAAFGESPASGANPVGPAI